MTVQRTKKMICDCEKNDCDLWKGDWIVNQNWKKENCTKLTGNFKRTTSVEVFKTYLFCLICCFCNSLYTFSIAYKEKYSKRTIIIVMKPRLKIDGLLSSSICWFLGCKISKLIRLKSHSINKEYYKSSMTL